MMEVNIDQPKAQSRSLLLLVPSADEVRDDAEALRTGAPQAHVPSAERGDVVERVNESCDDSNDGRLSHRAAVHAHLTVQKQQGE